MQPSDETNDLACFEEMLAELMYDFTYYSAFNDKTSLEKRMETFSKIKALFRDNVDVSYMFNSVILRCRQDHMMHIDKLIRAQTGRGTIIDS